MQPASQYINMIVPKAVALDDSSYSINVESVLYNSRRHSTTEGPYRHILHRGSKELEPATDAVVPIQSGCSSSTGDLPPFGLPKRLNPGIFLDPNTNDILIFIDTNAGTTTYRESLRIADIPLDKPFRLGITVKNRVVDVYLNCRLEATKVLAATPRVVENVWYGLSGQAAAQAQIQNLYVWPSVLTADDMNSICPKLPTFSVKRPICDSPPTTSVSSVSVSSYIPNAISGSVVQPVEVDLGFGKVLNKC